MAAAKDNDSAGPGQKRPPVDWDRIEPAWRAGITSVLQIAAEYEKATGQKVSHTAINKHFKGLGIPRDLSAKIRAKADALVSAAAVSAEVSTETKARDAEIVEANAAIQVAIRLEHRKDIAWYRKLLNKLGTELELATDGVDLLEQLAEIVTAEDKDGRRYQALMKAVGLPSRAGVMDRLAGSLKTLIALEREALGIDSGEKPEDPIASLVARIGRSTIDPREVVPDE